MRSIYTCHLRDTSSGVEAVRLARRVARARFAWDKHGCADGSISIQSPTRDLYTAYTRAGTPEMAFAADGADIWRGRLQSPRIGNKAIELVAAGAWQALGDVPYTALWSDTSVAEWRPLLLTELATAFPDRYTMDTQNRVYITANKNANLGTTTVAKAAYMVYVAPDDGARPITNISFDYAFSSQTNWQIGILSFDDSWGSLTGIYSLNGAGAGTVTGSQSLTLGTPRNRIAFYLYYNAADAVVAAETGDIFARMTNIRIKTTTASSVLASDIAAALATFTNTANPGQLASTSARIRPSTTDLRDEVYEDQYPAEILDDLALRSGYQAWVDLEQQLVFEPLRNNARTWLIEIGDFTLERPLDRVRNRRYATYEEAGGRTLRTADADDLTSYWRYGIRRSAPVATRTTSSSQATTQRDTALDDTEDPSPRASFTIRRILNSVRGAVPLHSPRPGDTALIVNLPASLPERDQVRAWTIGRVEVELARGAPAKLTLEPDAPTPKLVALLAKLENR